MLKIKNIFKLSSLLFLLNISIFANAQDLDDLEDAREGSMDVIKWQVAQLREYLSGDNYDPQEASRLADSLVALSIITSDSQLYSDAAVNESGDLSENIISNRDDFNDRFTNFVSDAENMKNNIFDKRALAAAFRQYTQSCKGCHDNYR